MRRASIAVLAVLVLSLPAAAAGPTTKPSADLAKENAELRAYVEQLEARIAALKAELKAKEKLSPRAQTRPLPPAPYGYQLPAPPFKLPAPTPSPALPSLPELKPVPPNTLRVIPPAPRFNVPENWQKREFNGTEFYLVPLE